jgi:hypothetical protein
MTGSNSIPSTAANAAISEDLPIPGSPHRQAVTPTRPAARRTVRRVLVPVIGDPFR